MPEDRNETGWLTNLEEVAEGLKQDCDRASPTLVLRVLVALRDGLRRVRGSEIAALEVGTHIDEDPPTPSFTFEHLEYMQVRDEYTGLVLRPEGIVKSRTEELEFAVKLGAWEPRPIAESLKRMGRRPFGVRWIDSNKGDDENEEYRSRVVVQETRRSSTIPLDDIAAVSSSTPPLEAIRLLISASMTWKAPPGEELLLSFVDISRAHPHCEPLAG